MSLQRAAGELDFSCVKNVIMNLMAAGAAVDGREWFVVATGVIENTVPHRGGNFDISV